MKSLFDYVSEWSKRPKTSPPPVHSAVEKTKRPAPNFTLTCVYNIWIVVLGCAALYTGSKLVETEKFFRDFLQEIGIALLVAYIIIITIEYRSRRELNAFVEEFTYQTHSASSSSSWACNSRRRCSNS